MADADQEIRTVPKTSSILQRKLTYEAAAEARRRYQSGNVSIRALAKEHSVGFTTMRNICNGVTYQESAPTFEMHLGEMIENSQSSPRMAHYHATRPHRTWADRARARGYTEEQIAAAQAAREKRNTP